MIDRSARNRTNVLIIIGLVIGTFSLYGRVAHFEYINFDDPGYVTANRHVLGGLNADAIGWAFTTRAESNWHPLMWLSLMLDVSLFGRNPGWMHIENVIFHAANSVILFLILFRMTQARWACAWVAAMFAWHPAHVESVAWISERKDVLSALFMMLCLLAYVRYTAAPGPRRFATVVGLLILSLLSKPMAVTLPCVMLLLDAWPLGRMNSPGDLRKRFIEKVPLFVLVILGSAATFWAQSAGRSVVSVPALPAGPRLMNAVLAYGRYLSMAFVPRHLAFFYPIAAAYPGGRISTAAVVVSAAVLLIVSTTVVMLRKKHPWLLVGWLWYLGTLVPVIGLVQVGEQSHADRYTYLPLIGIFIAIAWETQYRIRRTALFAVLGIATITACGWLSWRQVGYWRDTETLACHAIDVVPHNYVAHCCLGEALDARGEREGAIAEYQKTREIHPHDATAANDLALLYSKSGDDKLAMDLYRESIFSEPRYSPAYNNYGNLLMKQGRVDDAIKVYRAGVKQNPELPQIYHNLALALAGEGQVEQAIPLWQRALELDPGYMEARLNYGKALIISGETREGLALIASVLKSQPDNVDALITGAWTLATHPSPLYQNAAQAQALAQHAVALTGGDDPLALDALAAALARRNEFEQAASEAQRAAAVADARNNPALAAQIRKRVELYQSHQPFTSGR